MHTCQLGRSSTHYRDETRGVNDTPALGQTLLRVGFVLPHGEDSVFASPPNALYVDLHSQIPDLFFSIQRVIICGMHDPGIVELRSFSKHVSSLPKSSWRSQRERSDPDGEASKEAQTIISSLPNSLTTRSTAS